MGIGFLVRLWLTADRMLQFGVYVQLMRGPRMTDGSVFISMKMKLNMFDEILNRVGLNPKIVTPTSGKHFNQT